MKNNEITKKNSKIIVLASKSPRRLEILNRHGIDCVVIPSDAEEILPDGIGMEDAVELLSLQKARATYEAIKFLPEYSNSLIVAADTIVYLDEIMGKPKDYDDAFRMLSKIRNTGHYVTTGVTVIDAKTGDATTLHDVTAVYCKDYSDDDIREYIEEAQPYDKAGSYAIQGSFGKYIDHIDGDYENVVGLPFYRIEDMLKA